MCVYMSEEEKDEVLWVKCLHLDATGGLERLSVNAPTMLLFVHVLVWTSLCSVFSLHP